MPLGSNKGSRNFGGIPGSSSSSNLSPKQWAALIAQAAQQVGLTVTPGLVANAMGTIEAEGGFVPGVNWTSNGAHLGPWAESSAFGSVEDRLDPYRSTVAAMKYIASNGGNTASGFGAWWPFEESQGELEGGQKRAAKYVKLAEEVVGKGGSEWHPFHIPGVPPALDPGTIWEEAEGVTNAVGGAVGSWFGDPTGIADPLKELVAVVLDFKKLGSFTAQAFAWFLRLLARAIWDYVIHPAYAWTERAINWYWVNFFGSGTEPGSGFGHLIRANGGVITIAFWGLGYAILWSDGESGLAPVPANESALGRAVKKVEGTVARRNLIKPSDVKSKTPNKPKPISSTVSIEKVTEFSVSRNRPVKVTRPGDNGRTENERSRGIVPRPAPAPEKQTGTSSGESKKTIILPAGVQRPPQKASQQASSESGAGVASRTHSSNGVESSAGSRS